MVSGAPQPLQGSPVGCAPGLASNRGAPRSVSALWGRPHTPTPDPAAVPRPAPPRPAHLSAARRGGAGPHSRNAPQRPALHSAILAAGHVTGSGSGRAAVT